MVDHLAALAAGQVVLLTGSAGLEGLAAAYEPDVVVTDAGRTPMPPGSRHHLHPDLALLLSTSGSTGSPKLVRLSGDSLVANAQAIVSALGIRSSDVAATTLPLHYCYGLSVLHSHLLAGASLLLTDDSVVDASFWEDVAAHRVTTFPGVPHTFDLLERTGFAEREVPSLRYLTQAGGRMAPERVRALAELGERKGFDLVVMYGQTEATARMTVLPPDRTTSAPGSIGLPVTGGALAVEPVEGCAPGTGELVYSGPNVMLGYAESPADLARGRTIAVLRTGDLGRQRADGLWEVTGRRSRVAKVLGQRLDLDRVERLLAERGLVAAAADGADRLVLGVVSAARPVDPRSVRALVRETFGLPATAVAVVVLPDLPRLASGKTDYAALVAAGVSSTTEDRAPRPPRTGRPPTGSPRSTPRRSGSPRSGPGTPSSASAGTRCPTSRSRSGSSGSSAGCRPTGRPGRWPTWFPTPGRRGRAAASRPTWCCARSPSSASSAPTPTSSRCWAARTCCSRWSASTWVASSSPRPAGPSAPGTSCAARSGSPSRRCS